ncbi:CDP-alcohol phosphatidyltransferase family protein [Candidatus Poribacteria bacterium]|nr:CDP-alcohol phosphatidyltransferase family protein [Candidatus Poribacteria bacterium]MYH84005.1 CDP-alcohol phosphatidyltransferase family protein [Candidatus Poribacteria bacterium]MYK94246.1 CDP-alcohol phosphatidyltransferase family protein [Candidatus Poribacteria bacterium]
MVANIITLTRLVLTFVVIVLCSTRYTLGITLLAAIPIIFGLDAVDGIIARKRNETSEIGAVLDSAADRVIENTFWIYFTAMGLIPLWMPIVIMTRGILTDGLRHYITQETGRWVFVLKESRTSRGLYGGSKMFTFMTLMSSTIFKLPVLEQVSLRFAILTVVFCLIRGFPTAIEIYKTIEKKEADAKRFRPVPQSAERLTRGSSVPKKAVR